MSIFRRIFKDLNAKEINRYQPIVTAVNQLEPELEQLSDEDLLRRSTALKEKVRQEIGQVDLYSPDSEEKKILKNQINAVLDRQMAEAFALVREVSKRQIGLRHFDVQLIGGAVLHQGQVAEMSTGEGKTLVATLPLFLNALTGLGTHLVTVNDYLARRDAGWMAPIYHNLGLSVGVIGPEFSYLFDPSFTNPDDPDERLVHLKPASRQEAYSADITYGTNNEFGFDYLRDNMANSAEQLVQRPLHFAIVDEVDSILIDEARTPLIISAFSSESADHYQRFAPIMAKLKETIDYVPDEKTKTAALTDEGINKIELALGVENLFAPSNASLVHHADTALRAEVMYKKNRDYVVRENQVIIVDEFTGRMLQGRRYSSGLHQAIEAKEKVPVQQESVTLATITFQNYFRLYTKLAGMTGTATTEAEEFSKIYSLEVVTIPTHRPNSRVDLPDLIYKNEQTKFQAIVAAVKELQTQGTPILIGTVSIEKSERLSRLLKAAGIKHSVLNAKQHQREAKIIAQAGSAGAVTVATNMAGRGVDIVLGGEFSSEPTKLKQWETDHQKIIELGGLFVIGTERHESRRIDNQLRGRSARQGDPGKTQFYLSMEDDLMRIFGGDRMQGLMSRLQVPDEMAINNRLLTRAIEQAQSKVEGHNFDIRKQLVEYDDVMNRHRTTIYSQRSHLLMMTLEQAEELHEEILTYLNDEEEQQYQKKSKSWPVELRFNVEKSLALRVIDVLWVEHLRSLDELRDSIGLRGYAQRDPIVEYKQEAYNLFTKLQDGISAQIAQSLLHVEINQVQTASELPSGPTRLASEHTAPASKLGRNDPCPCGAIDPKTKKVYKYKKCGLINAPWHHN